MVASPDLQRVEIEASGVADWVLGDVDGRSVLFFVATPRADRERLVASLPSSILAIEVRSLGRGQTGSPDMSSLKRVVAATPAWCRQRSEQLCAQVSAPVTVALTLAPPADQLVAPELIAASFEGDAERGAGGAICNGAPAVLDGGPATLATDEQCLTDVLERAARRRPDRGITFIDRDEREQRLSYRDLWTAALRFASALRARGVQPRQEVILQLSEARDFLIAFWGCILNGVVPVPCGVPARYDEPSPELSRLEGARALLREAPLIVGASAEAAGVAALRAAAWEIATLVTHSPLVEPERAQPDDLALLLLTSGSTGVPRLVRQTHRAVLSRSAASIAFNAFDAEDVSLNWFPLDHVGGLLMFHVRDVVAQCGQVQAPLGAVLADPLRWLDWIERYRATITWAPNFAFSLLTSQAFRFGERQWDLSSLRFILNGGETVVAKHAQSFLGLLRDHGLRADSMHPAWGMTETCSGVTYSHEFATLPPDASRVPVGKPIPGTSVRIVDDEDRLLREGDEGHLQVQGASVTEGYHLDPDGTEKAFAAGGWFRTGDRAVIENGALSIVGRSKDIVIVNGLNLACWEIEAVAQDVPGVRPACVAAVAVRGEDDPTDRLAIFVSPRPDAPARLADDVRDHVIRELGVTASQVLLIGAEEFPRTAIGKIQRSVLRERFRDRLSGPCTEDSKLPHWFYAPVFCRRDRASSASSLDARVLVLCQERDAESFRANLMVRDVECVIAVPTQAGDGSAPKGTGWLEFDPVSPDEYRRVLATAWGSLGRVDHVIHALCCGPDATALSVLPTWDLGAMLTAVDRGHELGAESLLYVFQELAALNRGKRAVCVSFVTEAAQRVLPDEAPRFAVGAAFGLLHTARQEYPWLLAHAIDFDILDPELVIEELVNPSFDATLAYRNNQRWVSRLRRMALQAPSPSALRPGALVLLTGGLGGVGFEVARYLLRQEGAHLLIVGRTPLPDLRHRHEHRDGPFGEALARLEALERLGSVRYRAADVTRSAELERTVTEAEEELGTTLGAALHLACELSPGPIERLSVTDLREACHAKGGGALVLQHVLAKRPGAVLVSFSSVNGYFGGAGFGAYAAANYFLDLLGEWQRSTRVLQSCTLAFSMWSGRGLSRIHASAELAEANGFHAMTTNHALSSLQLLLHQPPSRVLVGLDGQHPAVTPLRADLPVAGVEVEVRCSASVMPSLRALLETDPLRDALGRKLDPRLTIEAEGAAAVPLSPQSLSEDEIREALSGVWRLLLDLDEVRENDNFFDLGGHSLIIPRAQELIAQQLHCELPNIAFFKYPTLAALARHIHSGAGRVDPATGPVTAPLRPREDRRASAALLRRARGL